MVPPLCGLPAAVVVGAASGLTPIEREYDHWHSPQQKTAARLSLTLGGEGTWRLCETHQLVTKQGFAGELVVDTAVTLTHAARGGCRAPAAASATTRARSWRGSRRSCAVQRTRARGQRPVVSKRRSNVRSAGPLISGPHLQFQQTDVAAIFWPPWPGSPAFVEASAACMAGIGTSAASTAEQCRPGLCET